MFNWLEAKTILDFMKLVVNTRLVFEQGYVFEWKRPEFNFYVDQYHLGIYKNKLLIIWENPNKEKHFVVLRCSPFKSLFWSRIYFFIVKPILTDDIRRVVPVLTQVVYPHFCKELGLEQIDFSAVQSYREAGELMLYSYYINFFKNFSVEMFINMFGLKKVLSGDALKLFRLRLEGKFNGT